VTELPDWLAACRSPLIETMGFTLTEITPERCAGVCPVDGNTQPAGFWHGGASCVMAETLGSMAAYAEVGEGGMVFGVDINATHHRAVRSGSVHGVATPLFVGGTTASYDVVLTDDDGRRICTARLTCALRRPRR
jgi:uncharacterized protein (TIGR00369 family)